MNPSKIKTYKSDLSIILAIYRREGCVFVALCVERENKNYGKKNKNLKINNFF
jgi:hypothetical protein